MNLLVRLIVLTELIAGAFGTQECQARAPRERLTIDPADSINVLCVAFSPDSKTLASVGRDPTIKLWDAATGQAKAELKGHTGEIWSVEFSPDGKSLVSAGRDKMVRLWDVASGKNTIVFEGHSDSLFVARFSPDGKRIASGGLDNTIKLWDVNSKKIVSTLNGHTDPVTGAAFSPDSKSLVSASVHEVKNISTVLGVLKVWNLSTEKNVMDLEGHTGSIRSVAYSPKGDLIASACHDGTARLWDVKEGKVKAVLKPQQVNEFQSLAFSKDGKRLAFSGWRDGIVELWGVETQSRQYVLKRPPGMVWTVAFSPDGKSLATGHIARQLTIWDLNPPDDE